MVTKRIEYLYETNKKDELNFIVENIQNIIAGTKLTQEIINEIDLKDTIRIDAKNLYDRRSKIVHNGDSNVSEQECMRFMFYLKISMLQILQLKEDNHYEKIDDIIKIIKENSN